METFEQFLESSFFQYDRENQNPQLRNLISQIDIIRRDPKFVNYDDHQIEMMLFHHNPQEVSQHGPERSLARHNDLSMTDDGSF